jgi:hypothetical protein
MPDPFFSGKRLHYTCVLVFAMRAILKRWKFSLYLDLNGLKIFLKRVLWKEFCLSRAVRMVSDLAGESHSSIDGNWNALGKLMIYYAGYHDTNNGFQLKICTKSFYKQN